MEGHHSLESYFKRVAEALHSLGVNVQSNTSLYLSKGLASRLKIIRFAHQHQADINHITGDIHFAALGTDPHRTVVTVADCGRLHQLSGFKRELLRQLWFTQPLNKVAAITVISNAVKDDLLRWVPDLDPDRIHVVPVSISPDFTFSPKPFNQSHPRILQVGTKPNKNIPRLIEALQGLKATLVIIGRLDQRLQELLIRHDISIENHNNITESQIIKLYQSADLVSFASTLEGFGMPILEAQATGRPVLTSNCASMPDVAGKGALLVDPTSVASIRSGLIRLIEDETLRSDLVNHGLANIHRFSSNAIAAQYLQIYKSLLQKSIQ
jgi:glycosyltransferase involved in cell wall biosynthesis